jgi:hypothetical protein
VRIPTRTPAVLTEIFTIPSILQGKCPDITSITPQPPPCNLRGRLNKWVAKGSKRSVMDVIRFLCVLLGSSTVQLQDSPDRRRACACSEAGFSGQNDDRV